VEYNFVRLEDNDPYAFHVIGAGRHVDTALAVDPRDDPPIITRVRRLISDTPSLSVLKRRPGACDPVVIAVLMAYRPAEHRKAGLIGDMHDRFAVTHVVEGAPSGARARDSQVMEVYGFVAP
jgi:hypothetical protein